MNHDLKYLGALADRLCNLTGAGLYWTWRRTPSYGETVRNICVPASFAAPIGGSLIKGALGMEQGGRPS